MQTLQAPLLRVLPLTHDVFQYDFSLEGQSVEFKAGQFFMLEVVDELGRVTRSYSICSAPSEKNLFSLCVKLIPGGRASTLLGNLKAGDTAKFMASFGHFFISDEAFNSGKPLIMVATGTGLAPFMSMLQDLFEREYAGRIVLYFGVRHEEDLFYVQQLRMWENQHLNFRAEITLSQPSEEWRGLKGRVTDHLQDKNLADTQVYICGNGDMVKSVKTMMDEKGVPKENLHWEQFTAL